MGMHRISGNNTHFANQIANHKQEVYGNRSKKYGKRKSFAFTDLGIKHLLPTAKRQDFWHSGLKGFGVRVSPSGTKSWFYLYRHNANQKRMILGHYPKMSLSQATKAYHELQEKVAYGIDPLAERQEKQQAFSKESTVNKLIETYIQYGRKMKKVSVEEERKSFERYITPKLGNKKISEIQPKDLSKIFHHIIVHREAPVMASRLYSYVRRLFNYAADMGLMRRRDNPCLDIKLKVKHKKRSRHLTTQEIYKFWNKIDDILMADITRLALKFMLVTMSRGIEVRNVKWNDINFRDRFWTLPKTKNGHVHRIYLGDQAINILEQARVYSIDANGYVFGSTGSFHRCGKIKTDLKPMSGRTLCQPLKRHFKTFKMTEPFTPHDLRRTGATLVAGLFGRRDLVKMCLNHVNGDVTSIYDQYTYDIEKKKAMNALNTAIECIINSSTIEDVPNFDQLRDFIFEKKQAPSKTKDYDGKQMGFQANFEYPSTYRLSYDPAALNKQA